MKVVILLAVLRVLGYQHFDEARRVADAIYEGSLDAPAPADPLLMTAIVERESGFRARAVSPGGDVGLTQVRAGTSTKLSRSQLLDPRNNVREGVRILNEKLRQCGDLPEALAAYNSGSCAPRGRAARRVRRYVRSVLTEYARLQRELTDHVQLSRAIE